MTDLRKLAALRREATPGGWELGEEHPADEFWFGRGFREVHGVPFAPDQYADAAYIAAVGSLSAEELDALADVQQRLTAARFVATYWRDAFMALDGAARVGAHPLALVLAALDGEEEPTELGIEGSRHDDFRAALDRLQETTR